jgi:hypothetical protein
MSKEITNNEIFENLDLTAEFLVSVSKTEANYDYYYSTVGNKKRSYRKDVNFFKISKGERTEKIEIEVNRQGIYDYLPEGLFHQPFSSKKGDDNNNQIIEEIKRQRENEKRARMFFLPIENEIFLHRLDLTKLENDLFLNNSESRNKYIDLIKHWRLSNIFSSSQIVEIIRFFPYLHLFRNKIKYIESCMTKMINYNVQITKVKNLPVKLNDDNLSWKLGEKDLGLETILSSEVNLYKTKYIVNIGEIIRNDYKKLLPHTENIKIINNLTNLFFSADSLQEINIFASKEENKLILSKEDNESFLGFNSYI